MTPGFHRVFSKLFETGLVFTEIKMNNEMKPSFYSNEEER